MEESSLDRSIDALTTDAYDPLKKVEWLSQEFFGNTLHAYTLAFLSFIATWVLLLVLHKYVLTRLAKLVEGRQSTVALLVSLLKGTGRWIFPLLAFYVAVLRLKLPDVAYKAIEVTTLAAVTFQAARIGGELLAHVLTRARGRANDPVRQNTNRNLTALVKFAAWTAAVLFVLDNMGFNISALVAGLGIGGVAIALATQAILGDAFSSFAIALDKPFEVGDFIAIDALMGTVEHIGLKTTRVRSLTGELLIFANSDLTKSRIKNYKRMYERRVVFKIGVVYQTPLEKLRRIPEILKDAVTAQPGTRFDRAHFAAHGDYALIHEVVYYVVNPDFNHYMDLQQNINLQIHEAFDKEGIKLAYPTQTVALTRPKS